MDGNLLGEVALWRMEHVCEGLAGDQARGRMRGRFSILLRYKELLRRYDLEQCWSEPKTTLERSHSEWCKMAEQVVRERELATRKERLLARPSTKFYARYLMTGDVSPALYLRLRQGRSRLAQWLFLHLRAGSLPLLARAATWSSQRWSRSLRVCLLCDSGAVEDEHHFLVSCGAMKQQRAQLLEEYRRRLKSVACELPLLEKVLSTVRGAGGLDLHLLLLGGPLVMASVGGYRGLLSACSSQVQEEAWKTAGNYLMAIWERRCVLLGGVVLPDKDGVACVERVRSSFECRLL